MIYVTHDQVEAMTLADKIAVLRDGLFEQVGRPMDLYRKPANKFVAGFMGSPKMNSFDASADKGKVTIDGLGARAPVARNSAGICPLEFGLSICNKRQRPRQLYRAGWNLWNNWVNMPWCTC